MITPWSTVPRRGLHRPARWGRALLSAWRPRSDDAVARFEAEAGRFFETRHAILTGSGREALAATLDALALAPGDEVLIPALTFPAVPAMVEQRGLVPVFFDVQAHDLQGDPEDCARRIGPRSRAVVATHLLGLPTDLARFAALCATHGLTLIEDFAQAAGARSGGRRVGGVGHVGFTSLETVKPLHSLGGGLLVTDDDALADRLRSAARSLPPPDLKRLAKKAALSQVEAALAHPVGFGLIARPMFQLAGGSDGLVARYKKNKKGAGNHHRRYHPVQARLGLRCLAALDAHLVTRRARVERLRGLLHAQGPTWLPTPAEDAEPSWYQLVGRSSDPQALVAHALARGVDIGPGVLSDCSAGACPRAAQLAAEVVQLPCHPGLSDRALERVARVVRGRLL